MDNGNANLNTNDMQNLHIKNQPSLQTTQLRSLTASTSITNGRNAADKITELTDILSSISVAENDTKEENGDNVTVKEDGLMQPTSRHANIPADIVNLQDGDRSELEEILMKEGDVGNTGDKSNVDDIRPTGGIPHVNFFKQELVLSDETNEVTANQSIASIGDYEKNAKTDVTVQVVQTQIGNVNDETNEVTAQHVVTTGDDGDKSGETHVLVIQTEPGVLNYETDELTVQQSVSSMTEGNKNGNKKGVCEEKTIMLVGATGSGKSTLIDGMINYITDVSWDDDFRFSLVDLTDDEKKKHKNQAESQTEWITCYTIHKMEGSKINFDLNIIDTPGFGDTRGIIRDKAIVDQIREFFTTPGDQGVAFLDAICFVTQAPMARLTPPQRYIFDSILSVFGQDVANNIFVLITFADGNEPPVRGALKAANVPFQKSFKFNNSALFASTGKAEEAKFGNLFWKMGQESFLIFFNELDQVDPKSLQLTTEVLQLRKNLEVTIQGLQPQITEGINKLNTIRQEQDVLKRHKTDIAANRNFTYEVDEIHMRKIDLEPGTYVTNCLTCNRTCHFPCGIPDDKGKHGCWAMSNGDCRICPKKCNWIIHKNNTFRFETYNVKLKKTYDELKKKYEIAQEEEKKQRSVLGKVRDAFSALGRNVMTMVHDVRGYINKLNEIALRPNPLSDIDYIDLLIESEKNEKKKGWDQRLKLFYKMREEAELVSKTAKANYKPWGTDADIINEIDD